MDVASELISEKQHFDEPKTGLDYSQYQLGSIVTMTEDRTVKEM